MALTQIANGRQIYSGQPVPTLTPDNPQDPAIYVQTGPFGNWVSEYLWDPVSQAWSEQPSTDSNWTFVESFGWTGKHNDTRRYGAPAFTYMQGAATIVPQFGVDAISASPIPFTIKNALDDSVLATGTFPAGVKRADATACALKSQANADLTTIALLSGEEAQLCCVPTSGHAAAPADGYGFQVAGKVIFG